jgi:hypothetical protein
VEKKQKGREEFLEKKSYQQRRRKSLAFLLIFRTKKKLNIFRPQKQTTKNIFWDAKRDF